MNANELMVFEVETTSKQIKTICDGLNGNQLHFKSNPEHRSILEQLEHICECYHAFLVIHKGGQHNWGSYEIQDKSIENIMKIFNELVDEAKQILLANNDEKTVENAFHYITNHDAYHVGQMARLRLDIEPEWDMYSIYK